MTEAQWQAQVIELAQLLGYERMMKCQTGDL
jgi:hypothetical protein